MFNFKKKYIAVFLIISAVCIGSYTIFFQWAEKTADTASLTKPPEEIKGKIITLRSLKEEYFIDFHNMFSNTVRKSLEFPESITLSYTIGYLHTEKEKAEKGSMILYSIFDNTDNKLIGSIEIRDLNDIDPGQLGCWINENYWGGGRIQEALNLITKTYFRLKSHETSYIAHVRLWNKRSYHALKKYGFEEIGYFYEDGRPARYILEYKKQ